MQNKLHNKEKFFAQYWGQNVLCEKENESKESFTTYCFLYRERVNHNSISYIDSKTYLELKTLSSITDEDANKITIYGEYAIKNGGFNEFGFDTPQGRQMYGFASVDFLRLKGYAIGWMGLSVDQLIEYGWIKLIS